MERPMCEVPVFYVTTDFEARRIADRIAASIRRRGLDSRSIAIISDEASHMDWRRVRAAAMAAPTARRGHQAEIVAFARVHRRALSTLPSLVVSIDRTPVEHSAAHGNERANRFARETGWRPSHVGTVVVARPGKRGSWITRLGARLRGVRRPPASDGVDVERCADELAREIHQREPEVA
jgi:menaquinone-dependent protoporphyrinogen IX oxidase